MTDRTTSALLYVPRTATPETPAPGIVAIHGYINSRETQSGFAIELARRGYVVLSVDQTGHGYSDPPAMAAGFGGPAALTYLRTLDFADRDNHRPGRPLDQRAGGRLRGLGDARCTGTPRFAQLGDT